MKLVENSITQKNVEFMKNRSEFQDQNRRESEKKLVPIQADTFDAYKELAQPIEQIYLNKLGEEFDLRVRCEYTPEGARYTATLKDQGEVVDGTRNRLEIETDISQSAYEFFASQNKFPTLKQLRAPITDNMTIDFIEGIDSPIIEPETHDATEREALVASLGELVEDRTGDVTLNKAYLAHELAGTEKDLYSPEALEAFSYRIAEEMIARYRTGRNQVVVGLTGMSGSGKTTVTKMISELFSDEHKPIVVSTDDYHRGKQWLEETYGAPWTEWDDPRVYNTAELAFDLQQLSEGSPLLKRHFDFEKEETVFDEELLPSPFVIVEGLYAGSSDLDTIRTLHYELPTGIATSVGRDVRRLVIEDRANRAFPTPESRLKYQIESALPLYLSQERPRKNSFSACERPMASRAISLVQSIELAERVLEAGEAPQG